MPLTGGTFYRGIYIFLVVNTFFLFLYYASCPRGLKFSSNTDLINSAQSSMATML